MPVHLVFPRKWGGTTPVGIKHTSRLKNLTSCVKSGANSLTGSILRGSPTAECYVFRRLEYHDRLPRRGFALPISVRKMAG